MHEHSIHVYVVWSNAHLISYSPYPVPHLGQSLLVPLRPSLLDFLRDGEVASQRVERRDGGVVVSWAML